MAIRGTRYNKYVENYVVFDLETTGISPIEISGIKVVNGKPESEFSTLVNPERPIPYGATKVNGINDTMVKEAPTLKEVFKDFLDFTGNEILVGHNIHTFDLIFLYQAAEELLEQDISNDYVDTLSFARICLPQLGHYKLTDIASHFSIKTDGAHRALNDCIMNQKCYEKMGKLLNQEDVVICPQCGGPMVKRNGRYGEFYGCSNFPNCRFSMNI